MAGSARRLTYGRSKFLGFMVPAIWLLALAPLFLSRLLGWQLAGCYDEQAFAVVAIVGYIAVVRQSLLKSRSDEEQAADAARAIRDEDEGQGPDS